MAESIPANYQSLISDVTESMRSRDPQSAFVGELEYSGKNVDWEGEKNAIMGAIGGADAALQSAKTPEERESILSDLVQLQTAANSLERGYQSMLVEQEAAIEAARAESMQNVASGEYRSRRPGVQVMSTMGDLPMRPLGPRTIENKEESKANLRDELGGAMGVHPDDVDIDTGLSALERADLAALPTDEDRAAFLQRRFKEGVIPFQQDGKTNFLVNKDGKLHLVDEFGGSAGDAAAATISVSKEGLPTLGALGGAVVGSPSTAGAAASGAAGYGVVAGLQDAAIRKAYGLDARPGEIAGRRGSEAAIMGAIDLGLMGSGKFLSRRFFGKQMGNEMADQLERSRKILEKEGVKIDQTAGAKFGPGAQRAETALSQMYPKRALSRRRDANMEQLGYLLDGWRKQADPERVAEKTLGNVRSEIERLAGDIASKENAASGAIEKAIARRLSNAQQVGYSQTEAGKIIQRSLKAAEEAQKDLVSKNYQGFYNAMDEAGYGMSYDDAISMIEQSMRGHKGFKATDRKGMYGIVDRISKLKEADPAGKLSFQDMHSIRRDLTQAGGDAATVGGSNAQNLAKKTAESFDAKLRNTLRPDMQQEWAQVNEAFKRDRLAFERGSMGRILRERYGDAVMSPKSVVQNALREPSEAAAILESAKNASPAEYAQLQKAMQDSYTDSLGLVARPGISPPTAVKYDREMLNALYGREAGAEMAAKYDALNAAFDARKIKLDQLDRDSLAQLEGAIGPEETGRVARLIATKAEAQQKAKDLADNAIIRMAKNRQWDDVNNGALASVAIDSGTTYKQFKSVVDQMPADEKEIFAQDFVFELLNTYQAGGMPMRNAPFMEMPNAGRFLQDIGEVSGTTATQAGRDLRKKMDKIMGPRKADTFIAAMKQIDANQVKAGSLSKDEIRAIVGMGGVSAYLAEGLGSFVKNRLMAAAFGSRKMEPFLRVLARDVGPAQAEKNFKAMVAGTVMTTRGQRALAQQMSRDPEFAKAMTELTQAMAESEEE